MKIFTKTKHIMLMVAIVLCANAAFAQEYGVVWSQDFEDPSSYTKGWSTAGSFEYATLSDGTHMLNINQGGGSGNRAASCSFNDEAFSASTDLRFEFDWGISASNQNSSNMSLLADNPEGFLFKLTNDAWAATSTIYASDGTTVIGTITNDGYTKAAPKTLSHFVVEVNSNGATLTVATGGKMVVDSYKLCDNYVSIKGFGASLGRAQTRMAFDNLVLSVLGAAESVTVPMCSITGTYGVTRTITITPGVGTEGTLAEATYYTTNGDEPTKESTKYTEPFIVSESCTVKAVSYLPDGTASDACEFVVKAGTVWPLNGDVVKIVGLISSDAEYANVVIDNIYNNEGVLGNPEVTFSYTFNGRNVEVPYTVTEDGVLVATAKAGGYESASEALDVKAAYMIVKSVDFTVVTDENITEVLGNTWSVTQTNTRWSGWDKSNGDIYSIATCSDPDHLTEFLGSTCGTMIVGYGVARNHNSETKYWINNGEEGQIALYEVNEAKRATTDFKQYAVAYADDNKMGHSIYNVNAIAKVSVYAPARELVAVEGENLASTGTYTSATYTRAIAAGAYGTICLPFAPDAASLENYTFFKMESAADGVISFVEEKAPVANTPYIYCLNDGKEATAITGGVTVVSATMNDVVDGDWTMKGSFTTQSIVTEGADAKYYGYVAAQNKIVKANKTLGVKPYRAYFTAPVDAAAVALRVTRGDETTEISVADLDVESATVIYDLAGRRVEKMERGIYIVNGKKVVK